MFTTFFRKNIFGINCQYLILVWEFVSVFAYKLEIYCNPGIFNWVTFNTLLACFSCFEVCRPFCLTSHFSPPSQTLFFKDLVKDHLLWIGLIVMPLYLDNISCEIFDTLFHSHFSSKTVRSPNTGSTSFSCICIVHPNTGNIAGTQFLLTELYQ